MVRKSDIKVQDLPPAFQQLAEEFGAPVVFKIIEKMGGEYIYIPSMKTVLKNVRDRLICEEFDGKNYRQLARKYSISMTHVREVIKILKKSK